MSEARPQEVDTTSLLGEEGLLEKIERAFAEVLGVDEMKTRVEMALAQNIPPFKIIQSMREGLSKAGRKYEEGEYFLSELIMSGIMAQELSKMLKPYIQSSRNQFLGKVIIGTVKGDLHDIGKNLVSTMLSSAGFEIIDLGVDVSTEKFIGAVEKENPDIVAMSCLLTIAMDEMKGTIDVLKQTGLEKKVKVLVGGRPITLDFAREIGADGYGSDAIEAVSAAMDALRK